MRFLTFSARAYTPCRRTLVGILYPLARRLWTGLGMPVSRIPNIHWEDRFRRLELVHTFNDHLFIRLLTIYVEEPAPQIPATILNQIRCIIYRQGGLPTSIPVTVGFSGNLKIILLTI